MLVPLPLPACFRLPVVTVPLLKQTKLYMMMLLLLLLFLRFFHLFFIFHFEGGGFPAGPQFSYKVYTEISLGHFKRMPLCFYYTSSYREAMYERDFYVWKSEKKKQMKRGILLHIPPGIYNGFYSHCHTACMLSSV